MASTSHDPYRGHSRREDAPDAEPDWDAYTVAELRWQLGELGLSTAGKKAVLVARLLEHG